EWIRPGRRSFKGNAGRNRASNQSILRCGLPDPRRIKNAGRIRQTIVPLFLKATEVFGIAALACDRHVARASEIAAFARSVCNLKRPNTQFLQSKTCTKH